MKIILVLISILLFLSSCTSQSNVEKGYSPADSVFVFAKFLNYDIESKTFDDLDEPTVYDYWYKAKLEAIGYFNIALKMKSVPPAQKMIFASYLLKNGVEQPVEEILSGLKTKSDTAEVYYIMDSYGISFKKFNISEGLVREYCPDLGYK